MTDFATKVKRVTTRHHFPHLDVPKIEFGSPAVKTNDVVAARGRRPSIAPVPAMLGEGLSSSSSSSSTESESETPPVTVPVNAGTNVDDEHEKAEDDNHNGRRNSNNNKIEMANDKFVHQKDQWAFPAERSL